MDDAEVRKQVEALESQLGCVPPDAAPAIETLMRLYGETLERIVTMVQDRPETIGAFAADELIGHMLLLHEVALPMDRPSSPQMQRCDLCAEELPETHPHLFDMSEKGVLCACAVCALLFPARADAGGRYRFVPEGVTYLQDFALDELTWSALEIPVGVAYFVRSGQSDRVVAYYPSPAGAVESLLKLDAWHELEELNPQLAQLVPDTQALLVNGGGSRAEGWIVGIDACYRLIGLVRANWRGLRGGEAVRKELERFFDELRAASGTHCLGGSHVIKGVV